MTNVKAVCSKDHMIYKFENDGMNFVLEGAGSGFKIKVVEPISKQELVKLIDTAFKNKGYTAKYSAEDIHFKKGNIETVLWMKDLRIWNMCGTFEEILNVLIGPHTISLE